MYILYNVFDIILEKEFMMSIREKFNVEKFNLKFKGTRAFTENDIISTPEHPNYFQEFLDLLDNEEALGNIRFANDYLEIPPVKSFINFRRELFQHEMDRNDKQCLGACFAYLFKDIYGYENSHSVWVGDVITDKDPKRTGIKTATVYTKNKSEK